MDAQKRTHVDGILSYLANAARSSGGGLAWQEVAKVKADLMRQRQWWAEVPVSYVSEKLHEFGMSAEDRRTLTELLSRVQAGGRLVPQASYRDFEFQRRD